MSTDRPKGNYVIIRYNKDNEFIDMVHMDTYDEAKRFIEDQSGENGLQMGESVSIFKIFESYSAKVTKNDVPKEPEHPRECIPKETPRR